MIEEKREHEIMKINSEKLQLLRTIFQGIIALGVVVILFREIGLPGSIWKPTVFSLSVVFQVSGAVILLLGTFGKPGRLSFFKVSIEAEVMERVTKSVSLSRAAFAYLAAGYLLTIFGRPDYGNIWIMLVFVLAGSAVLVAVTFLIAKVQVKKPEGDEEITVKTEQQPSQPGAEQMQA